MPPNMTANPYAHSHEVVADGSVVFQCSRDLAVNPWLALAPHHVKACEKFACLGFLHRCPLPVMILQVVELAGEVLGLISGFWENLPLVLPCRVALCSHGRLFPELLESCVDAVKATKRIRTVAQTTRPCKFLTDVIGR